MKRPIQKVYLVDGSIAMTGAFVSAREIARALHDEVDVILVLPQDAAISNRYLSEFAGVRRIAIKPLRRTILDAALYIPFLIIAAFQLRYWLWRDRAEVLILNDFYLMQGALVKLLLYRGPVMTWVRIDPSAFGKVASIWLWMAKKSSNQIVSVSRHIQSCLPKHIRSELLYDPVSVEFLPEPQHKKLREFNFVFIGNYIVGKGQDVALEALSKVLPEYPSVRLLFYGGDLGLEKNRAYRLTLEERAVHLGVTHAVCFGDFIPSPRAVLSGAFASLNLSRSESFSRTVLEACACGLPVIATRCGGPEEIVLDQHTGFLIPIGDAKKCAEAMIRLCTEPELAARLGEQGRTRVMGVFNPQVYAAGLRELIGKADHV
ncbi:glycosyltransferase family 4 protein [Flavimaricola sp.]|nr:glycosyltransferase family 4 protein [Flavimaricola sp.]MDA9020159.1 glycosyltransferase family 4 protein [Flavimaricola sp.]